MTMNLSALLARIHSFTAGGGEADERIDTLLLRGRFVNAAAQVDWLSTAKDLELNGLPTQIYNLAVDDNLIEQDDFDPVRDVSITIRKPVGSNSACFFLQEQLQSYFLSGKIARTVLVADISSTEGFSARGLTVAPWDLQPPAPTLAIEKIDPTPFVRDFVPAREVPVDLAPWILASPPAQAGAVFDFWRAIAARRLLAGLVSSAFEDNGTIWLQASGPPIYRLRADDGAILQAFDALTDATQWVFLSGRDVEARHIIFASELARASRLDLSVKDISIKGLESAKATYEAHVQSSSRETLKALGELRKTVIDETQKVTQKAQDLTAGLWRDVAVTIAPFILKLLGDAGKVTDPRIAAGFYFAAAIFIIVSFTLQWRINSAFLKSQSESRGTWLLTLYNYISEKERDEIAEKPIKDALANYRQTRAVLTLLYAFLVAVLLSFGCAALPGSQPAPAKPAPAKAATQKPAAVSHKPPSSHP
jgi:hypothetical protein